MASMAHPAGKAPETQHHPAPLAWQQSSFAPADPHHDGLEVARGPDGHLRLRTRDAPDAVLTTTPARWAALLAHLRRHSSPDPPPP